MKTKQFVTDSLRLIHGMGVEVNDSNTALLERQLEDLDAVLYQERLRPLDADLAIPLDFSINPGAKTATYNMYTRVGMAKIIAAPGDDLPRSDIFATSHTANIRQVGTSIAYNVDELRGAAMANVPLETERADSARRAIDEKQNSIAWNGDAANGLEGFLTNPNITKREAALNAGGTSRSWANKTPLEMVADVNDMFSSIRVLTKKAFIGDTLLMPISLYELAARTPMSATLPNQTVLNWLLSADSRSGIRQILDIDELETAGPGGTRMMVAYEKNPRVLQQRIALPMTMHPPQARNLEFVIPVEAKFAGVVVRYPVACQFSFGM